MTSRRERVNFVQNEGFEKVEKNIKYSRISFFLFLNKTKYLNFGNFTHFLFLSHFTLAVNLVSAHHECFTFYKVVYFCVTK